MDGDPAVREPVPVRGVASARGGRRGRRWGDILSDCSYSHTGSRGCDGGGVFSGVLKQLITACVCLVYHYQSSVRMPVFVLSSVVSLSSLAGEMEGKEREREEN